MRGTFKGLFLSFALLVGVAATATEASAQRRTYRTRDGRTVTVRPDGTRVYRSPYGRTVRRPNGRTVVTLPNGRRVVRSSRSRQYYPQASRARTYRLPSGRLVTVYPNGRRVYH